jgi:hypothetical protein
MIIRVILLILIALVGYYGFVRRRRSPVDIVVIMALVGTAAFCVIDPEATNAIAHAVGVGRGADLVTYLVEVALLFIVLHYHARLDDLRSKVTVLARELALLRADLPRRDGSDPT